MFVLVVDQNQLCLARFVCVLGYAVKCFASCKKFAVHWPVDSDDFLVTADN